MTQKIMMLLMTLSNNVINDTKNNDVINDIIK